jgi:membrane-associated phospholipid phosphatase
VGTAIETVLKTVLGHPGPPPEVSRSLPLPDWMRLLSPHLTNAFPSGHAFRATYLAGLAVGGPRAIAVAAVVFAFATCLSRVYAGDHWPSDVVGGLFLGIALAAIERAARRAARTYGAATER